MMLVRLLVAFLWTGADGLQGASRERSAAVHIEGLSADTWEEMFHHSSSSWLDRVRVPPRAQDVHSIQEHMLLAQQSAQNIGRQMGVPYMPHDFRENLGDGSADGMRAKAFEHFGAMKRQLPALAGVVDIGLSQIGGQSEYVHPEQAFEQYSMVAQRMGAKSLAHQLAPLLRSTTPPNPSMMFNLIGNMLTTNNMPPESVRFYQEMARMYSSGQQPTQYHEHRLQNLTLQASLNRTARRARRRMYAPPAAVRGRRRTAGMPDYYKNTKNQFFIAYSLPCKVGSKVCFSLSNEFYSGKAGPGTFSGEWRRDYSEEASFAMGIATQTPWSFIATSFYLYPSLATGHEYDLKFVQGEYLLNFAPKTSIEVSLRLRESPACIGTGEATADDPRVDTCPLACLILTGGAPQIYSILEIEPLRAVDKDSLMSYYDLMKYGGPLKGPWEGQLMPSWAWVGFYRQV